jgi:YD repeat-containing protein
VSWFQSKVSYDYDAASQIQATTATTIQHDPSYDTSTPRGNLTSTTRWDTTDPNTINDGSKKLTSLVGYDTNGSPVWSRDAAQDAQHQSNISYTDSFSADGVNNTALSFATFAYPTTITDPDGNSSTVKFNFDFGAVTRAKGPPPAGYSDGAIQKMTYDGAGRISRVDNLNNSAYVRWDYVSWVVTKSATIQDGAGESHTVAILNGFGGAVATGGDNPGSAGGSWAKFMISDLMGRSSQFTNPTEINSGWAPSGDDAAGWNFSTPIVYDWKGRPRYTYNIDNTYKTAEYGGCGCAGSEVVTLTDEVGRKQKSYADPLGRTYKVEVLNSDNSVYSTRIVNYNVRDQVAFARQYQGLESSGVYQEETETYDGYGRLATRKAPIQTSPTTFTYYDNDQTHTVTDARGATTTLTYNQRGLPTIISYSGPMPTLAMQAMIWDGILRGIQTSCAELVRSCVPRYVIEPCVAGTCEFS